MGDNPTVEDPSEDKSWKEKLFGRTHSDEELGEKLAGGSDRGQELADEIIDAFNIPLDPEEQEMVREEIGRAKREKKRRKVRRIVSEKLNERESQPEPDGSLLTINSDEKGGDLEKLSEGLF